MELCTRILPSTPFRLDTLVKNKGGELAVSDKDSLMIQHISEIL